MLRPVPGANSNWEEREFAEERTWKAPQRVEEHVVDCESGIVEAVLDILIPVESQFSNETHEAENKQYGIDHWVGPQNCPQTAINRGRHLPSSSVSRVSSNLHGKLKSEVIKSNNYKQGFRT